MSAGRRRDLVRVLNPVETDDGRGGQTVEFEDGPLRWAEVRSLTAREQAIASAIQVVGTHVVSMPYEAAITTDCRLARVDPEGTTLQILGKRDPDGRRRDMELDCSEAVSA